METYGDLKRTINNVLAKKKAERVGKAAVGAVISAIPGLGAAKDVFDVGKALFNKPDSKKTNTWLDKLDVDDEEIVKRILNRGKTSGREDDNDEMIIRNRISIFNDETSPVYNYYDKSGKSTSINGIGSLEEIFFRLSVAIDAAK